MKHVMKPLAAAVVASVLVTGCGVGKFAALSKVHKFTMGLSDNKFVKEGAFIVMWGILPVYGLAALGDGLLFNSIEFWTGSNPLADAGTSKTIHGKDGSVAQMTLRADGGIDVSAVNAAGKQVEFTLYRDGEQVSVVDRQGLAMGLASAAAM